MWGWTLIQSSRNSLKIQQTVVTTLQQVLNSFFYVSQRSLISNFMPFGVYLPDLLLSKGDLSSVD